MSAGERAEPCDSCVGLGYCPECEAKWSALSCPHGCSICGSMGSHMEREDSDEQ